MAAKTSSSSSASKTKYRISLTYYGEDHVFFTYAKSEHRALKNAINRMAKKFSMNPSRFFKYFDGERDNFSVLKIVDNS